MADKEPMIVIKKITINPAGGHGGAWKVAFADFMTALMAFFLVMWLVAQSAEVKKNVADYFSTPSIIEYNFSNFGVELTLEKLFLDLVNEPLKFFQTFIKPADYTPNIMSMGSKKVALHFLADQLGDVASNVQVHSDEMVFEIPSDRIFQRGTSKTKSKFIEVMDKVKQITAGLEDSNIYIDSKTYAMFSQRGSISEAKKVAGERLDLISKKVEVSLEHETVDIYGKTAVVEKVVVPKKGEVIQDTITIRIKQKEFTSDGKKSRKLEGLFGEGDENMDVYNNFVKKLTDRRVQKRKE